MLKLGPNSKDGDNWDECGNTEIVQILISYEEDKIKSIQFVYAGGPAGVRLSKIYGETTGSYFKSVVFDYPSEFLTSVSGKYVRGFLSDRLGAIAFGTNIRKYGPFGKFQKNGSDFNYEFGARDSRGFGGFHGTAYKSFISSIGIYVKPVQTVKLPSNRE